MPTTATNDPNIDRILVPIDFSASSEAAFRYAMELAEGFDAKVDVLHVWTRAPEPTGAMIGEVGTQPPPVLNTIAEQSARQGLERFLEDHEAFSDRIGQTLLLSGHPGRVIVEVAKENDSDLIAMGTRGRTGLSRLVMGSVAEKVVRHVACPVLMIPTDAVDEKH